MDPIWCCITYNFYTHDRKERIVSRNMKMVSQLAQAGGIVQPGEFFDLDLKRMFQEFSAESILRLLHILQENGVEFEPVINDVAANTLFWYGLRPEYSLPVMKYLVTIGCIDPMRTQWPWNTGDSTWQGHLLHDVIQANGRWVTCIVDGYPPQVLLQDIWLHDEEFPDPMEFEPAFTKVCYPRGTSLYEMAETDLKIQRELDDAMKMYSGTINAYQISLTQTPLPTGPRSIVARYLCRSTTYATCG